MLRHINIRVTKMTKVTQAELITTAEQLVGEHDCPYAHELLRSKAIQHLGALGFSATKLDNLLMDLGLLHSRNTCPPTHHGRGLSHEWMVWSGDVAAIGIQARAHGLAA